MNLSDKTKENTMEYRNYYTRHLNGINLVTREELVVQVKKVGQKSVQQTPVNNSLFTDFCTPALSEEKIKTIIEAMF